MSIVNFSPITTSILNATAVIDSDGTLHTTALCPNEELLLPNGYEHSSYWHCRPSNPRIDKWLQRPITTVVVSYKGDVIAATNNSNTLSLWIDLTRSIRFTTAFDRKVLWTAEEMAQAEIEA